MARYEMVNVICPCGYNVVSKKCNVESSSRQTGTATCPACKRKVRWSIVGGTPSAGYQN
jgi:hypothetical protein